LWPKYFIKNFMCFKGFLENFDIEFVSFIFGLFGKTWCNGVLLNFWKDGKNTLHGESEIF
jgi:hypothetical protein